jgi:hypothetical protein
VRLQILAQRLLRKRHNAKEAFMQSRWRSTLCGSRVKTTGEPITIESEPSKILSTGGQFIPHRSKAALRSMPMLFLPKEQYEVLACEDGRSFVRYAEEPTYLDDMDLADNALNYFDSKMSK